jgi:2-keto-4-pentenoate hydratase
VTGSLITPIDMIAGDTVRFDLEELGSTQFSVK